MSPATHLSMGWECLLKTRLQCTPLTITNLHTEIIWLLAAFQNRKYLILRSRKTSLCQWLSPIETETHLNFLPPTSCRRWVLMETKMLQPIMLWTLQASLTRQTMGAYRRGTCPWRLSIRTKKLLLALKTSWTYSAIIWKEMAIMLQTMILSSHPPCSFIATTSSISRSIKTEETNSSISSNRGLHHQATHWPLSINRGWIAAWIRQT